MSRENVEIVRAIYEALANRDATTPYELYAPDIEWDVGDQWMGVGVGRIFHGHEGVRTFWRELLSEFPVADFAVEDLVDAGDHVLAVLQGRFVGRTFGPLPVGRHYAAWALRDGKVVRMQVFTDRDEALEAVGLRE